MKKLFGGGSDAKAETSVSNQEAHLVPDAVGSPALRNHPGSMEFSASDSLNEQQKRGLAGLCACLLPEVTDGSQDLNWSKSYLKLLVESFLGLPASQAEAYVPILTAKKLAIQERTTVTRSQSKSLLSFMSKAAVEVESDELDVAPFLALVIPDPNRSRGLKGWLRKQKLKKERDSLVGPGSESPDVLSLDEFRAMLLKKQLWFTVKAIGYDARARILLRHMAAAMGVEWAIVTREEMSIGRALFAEATGMPLEKVEAKPTLWDWKRNATIGGAAVVGGALLAVTGGIFAATAIASGFTALGGAGIAIGTAMTSTAGVTASAVLFGTAGAGVVGMKTDTRTRGVHEFNFDLVTAGDGMNVYICVSGWMDDDDPPTAGFRRAWGDSREYLRAFYRLNNPEKVEQVDQIMDRYKGREDDFFTILRQTYHIDSGSLESDPLNLAKALKKSKDKRMDDPDFSRAWRWQDRFQQGDQYCLVWEEAMLRRFGKNMRTFVSQQLSFYATTELIQYTALSTLFAAVTVPRTILRMADMIDSIWAIAMSKADECGKLLAGALHERKQGLRPVTLIGYGMGARMIFSCLKHLAKVGKDEGYGIVENAVLLGTPVPVVRKDWANARRVVAGRLINGYSENDWMLGIMYRYQGWAFNSAGISPLDVPGVENANLSSIIQGHLEYKNKIGAILDMLKLEG